MYAPTKKKTMTKKQLFLNKCYDRPTKIGLSIKLLLIGLHLRITKIPTLISLRFTTFKYLLISLYIEVFYF